MRFAGLKACISRLITREGFVIELGQKVKDRITGFEGVVTGRCAYISGCDQALVTPPVDKEGKHVEAHWFDVQRLQVLPDRVITLDNGLTLGADVPAPIR